MSDSQTTLGKILCWLGLHAWVYNVAYWCDPKEKRLHERHCNRCHRHEQREPVFGCWQKSFMSGYPLPCGKVRNP